jgi:hypothetical protein
MQDGQKLFQTKSEEGVFQAGTKVSHTVILDLVQEGKIDWPAGTSLQNPFTLCSW